MGLMNSADTMAQLQRGLNGTDFFLHIGDLSYAVRTAHNESCRAEQRVLCSHCCPLPSASAR